MLGPGAIAHEHRKQAQQDQANPQSRSKRSEFFTDGDTEPVDLWRHSGGSRHGVRILSAVRRTTTMLRPGLVTW